MRITCPHCQKSVVVADGSAGTPTPCPLCGNIFTPPALAGSALDLPPAPPPAPAYQPPPSPTASKPVAAAATPADAPRPESSGLRPCCRCVLRRDVVQWLAPGGLILVFLLTFFTWVESAPAGYTIFTQSAWGAAFGSFSESLVGNDVAERKAALL